MAVTPARNFATKSLEAENEVQPEKRLKFSAFAKTTRDYSVDEVKEMRKKMETGAEPFLPKPEYSHIEFDKNVRHRFDEIDPKFMWRSLLTREPGTDP